MDTAHEFMGCQPGSCGLPHPMPNPEESGCHWPYGNVFFGGNKPYRPGDPFCLLTEAQHTESLVKLVHEYRSLLESAEYELDWLTLHHVVQKEGKDWKSSIEGLGFFECDCAEDGGYMEFDTNAYIHAENCASGHEDSMAALHDQIKQMFGKD